MNNKIAQSHLKELPQQNKTSQKRIAWMTLSAFFVKFNILDGKRWHGDDQIESRLNLGILQISVILQFVIFLHANI